MKSKKTYDEDLIFLTITVFLQAIGTVAFLIFVILFQPEYPQLYAFLNSAYILTVPMIMLGITELFCEKKQEVEK